MSDSIIPERRQIPVIIDKSHLITIGERLYGEKMSFIRELVNNAYDADATRVTVEITPENIVITDNGTGMDEAGLRGYFTIGGSIKKTENLSHRLKRKRIGEFGIGKFSALAVCKKFTITTQRGSFRAVLIFDKEHWSQHDDWYLDIDVLPALPTMEDGTSITLSDISTTFHHGHVRRYLAERTPIHASNFAVFLNSERVAEDFIAGKNIPIHLKLPFGNVDGNLIITGVERQGRPFGIAILVKGVLIRYEPFGIDRLRQAGATRLTGRISADFLPITSSRDDFLRDSPEFSALSDALHAEIRKALKVIREDVDRKADLQSSRVLKEALQKIGRAMKRRKGLFPEARVPMGSEISGDDSEASVGYNIGEATFVPADQSALPPDLQKRMAASRKAGKRVTGALGKRTIIRTLTVANLDIAVRLEHLGAEEESFLSGGVIYLNVDHPLYKSCRGDDGQLTQHIARVITKELALQSGISDPRQAFALQADLLADALQ
ncbi:MAG: ATP-binding protein [Candidatus Uhrbacteria bacterium]